MFGYDKYLNKHKITIEDVLKSMNRTVEEFTVYALIHHDNHLFSMRFEDKVKPSSFDNIRNDVEINYIEFNSQIKNLKNNTNYQKLINKSCQFFLSNHCHDNSIKLR
jgi:hypothetical protein